MTLGVPTKKYMKRPQASHRSRFDEPNELSFVCDKENTDGQTFQSVITAGLLFGLGCRDALR